MSSVKLLTAVLAVVVLGTMVEDTSAWWGGWGGYGMPWYGSYGYGMPYYGYGYSMPWYGYGYGYKKRSAGFGPNGDSSEGAAAEFTSNNGVGGNAAAGPVSYEGGDAQQAIHGFGPVAPKFAYAVPPSAGGRN